MARALPAPAATLDLGALRAALAWPAVLRREQTLVLAVVAVGLVGHGLNMFLYPAFTAADDEGIYASQAWAVLREAALSPYTYVYDHVPGGWILVAAWMAVSGGPHAFGSAVDSGRVLMLLLHLATLPMLYGIARKLGCSLTVAALATLLFTVSPLSVFHQRRLLLDNIMLFWALLSLYLLLDGWGRLTRVSASGLCFGIALVSKETAIFLLPGMLFMVWQQRWRHQGRFALFGWLVPMLVVVSWYPLYALLKGELWPTGGVDQFANGYGAAGVSLIDSLAWQLGRDGGGAFNLDNQFWTLMRGDWLPRDAVVVIAGVAATALNVVRGLRRRSVADRRNLATSLLTIVPLFYLARGGIVFDFYILLVLPFLWLNLALVVEWSLAHLPRAIGPATVVAAALSVIAGYWLVGNLAAPLYSQRPGQGGREALTWIKQNVPPQSAILVEEDLWTDLREPGLGGPAFPNVQTYTKLVGDPSIHTGFFHDDWQNVDYLVLSPRVQDQLSNPSYGLALAALENAHLVQRWSIEGSQLELWKVDKPGPLDAANLADSDAFLSHQFEQNGAFEDSSGTVTSEAEADAMLRGVWSDDRPGFERAWAWTSTHLLTPDQQLYWHWREGSVVDAHSASDAETDVALALVLAGARWREPALTTAGRELVAGIWTHDVVTVDGRPYMSAGNWAAGQDPVVVNPSYFAPYAYRLFEQVDPDHDWLGLIDAGYPLLFDASVETLGSAKSVGLPPDWVALDRGSGELRPLVVDGADTTRYGFDAPRTFWRVALDAQWYHDARALAYLGQAGILRDDLRRSGTLGGAYEHDGTRALDHANSVGTAGAVAAVLSFDADAATELYVGQFVRGGQRAEGGLYWDDPSDLYAQEWGWFVTAFYQGVLQPFPVAEAPLS